MRRIPKFVMPAIERPPVLSHVVEFGDAGLVEAVSVRLVGAAVYTILRC
jgi:hypothetical protein